MHNGPNSQFLRIKMTDLNDYAYGLIQMWKNRNNVGSSFGTQIK